MDKFFYLGYLVFALSQLVYGASIKTPLMSGVEAYCFQGNNTTCGGCTHTPGSGEEWAFDFGVINTDFSKYPVVSPVTGVVRLVYEDCTEEDGFNCNYGFGNQVIIEYGEDQFRMLCHFSYQHVFVWEGESVQQGQVLALGGNTGWSTTPHVHDQSQYNAVIGGQSFETSYDDAPSDGKPVAGDTYVSGNSNIIDLREDEPHNGLHVLDEFGDRDGGIQWFHDYNPDDLYYPDNTPKNCYVQHYQGGQQWGGAIVYDALGGARKAYIVGWNEWNYWFPNGGPTSSLGMPVTNSYWIGGVWRQDFQKGYLIYDQVHGYGDDGAVCAPGWTDNGWNPKYSYLFAQIYEDNGARPQIGVATTFVYQDGDRFVQDFNCGQIGPARIVFEPSQDPAIPPQIYIEPIIVQTWQRTGNLTTCSGPPKQDIYEWYQPEFNACSWQISNMPDHSWGCNYCDRYYRYWFYYPGTESGTGVSIHFRSDDGIELYVNGQPLGEWGAGCHGDGCVNHGDPDRPCGNDYLAPDIDITSYLHKGNNLIAAHVSERKGGEYFSLSFDNPPLESITSDAICCIGGSTCKEITDAYSGADCLQEGGNLFMGGWLDCDLFSSCNNPQRKVKSDPLLSFETALPLPDLPAELTFTLIDTLPSTAYYDLPDSLGGYRLYVSNFSGQFTVLAQPGVHPDTVDLALTDYSFECPSVQLGGFQTGTNYVRLDTSAGAVNRGTYTYSSRFVEVIVQSILFNDLFPESNPIRCRSHIRGHFNMQTGILQASSIGYNVLPETEEAVEGVSAVVPDTLYAFYAYAIEPIMGTVYIGDFASGYAAADVDLSSITVNGSTSVDSASVIPSAPGFSGPVVEGVLSLSELVADYMPLYDTTIQQFSVGGQFTDGRSFLAAGSAVFIGHISGDVNNDGELNVADLTFLVDYLFHGGPEPPIPGTADLNHDGKINISDLVELVDKLF